MMTVVLIGIGAWLAISLVIGIVVAKSIALGQDDPGRDLSQELRDVSAKFRLTPALIVEIVCPPGQRSAEMAKVVEGWLAGSSEGLTNEHITALARTLVVCEQLEQWFGLPAAADVFYRDDPGIYRMLETRAYDELAVALRRMGKDMLPQRTWLPQRS